MYQPPSAISKDARKKMISSKPVFNLLGFASLFAIGSFVLSSCESTFSKNKVEKATADTIAAPTAKAIAPSAPVYAPLDTLAYDKKNLQIANGDSSGRWPVKAPYPGAGAILPFNRIIAYYGNLYSKRMGVLGEYPPDEMIAKLKEEKKKWEAADPSTPVIPALHYIAVTAQGSPGKGNKYRLRMPFNQIDSILNIAKRIDALVFIDVQVALSTLQDEIPLLEKYLSMPNVHLGIDPEFSMKTGKKLGSVIGTFDAADINYTSQYLAELVKKYNLPPKILIVHRFTQGMVTNTKLIKTRPEVQMVMDMDGWGFPAKKVNTYRCFIDKEPVQFTGFKLFYKNDIKSGTPMMTPEQVLKLKPQPIYIQYQ